MPNWCEGNIRFRGKCKDIKRFLMNEIVVCSYERKGDMCETVERKPEIDDKGYELTITKPDHAWFYIKTTHRNFFETDVLEIWLYDEEEEKETVICVDNFRAAWSFDKCDAWKDFAKEYNMDVRMVGFERGMEFSQIKTIYRDGKVKDEIKEYTDWEDWMWNATLPNNGG